MNSPENLEDLNFDRKDSRKGGSMQINDNSGKKIGRLHVERQGGDGA